LAFLPKGALKGIVFLFGSIIFVGIIYNVCNFQMLSSRKEKERDFWVIRNAVLSDIKRIEHFGQDFQGNHVNIVGYRFNYFYEVNGKNINGQDILRYQDSNYNDIEIVDKLEVGDSVSIRVNPENIRESLIKFNN
tara:strand:+ start:347 stop:751 length:405 start_codon:yes stop_codon:yes gene_type:complete